MTTCIPLVVTVPKATLVRPHLTWYEDERSLHRREYVSRSQVRDEDTDWLVPSEGWSVIGQSYVLLDGQL
jgi:hypothetical protein